MAITNVGTCFEARNSDRCCDKLTTGITLHDGVRGTCESLSTAANVSGTCFMAHTSDKCPGVTTHKRVTFNDSVRDHKVLARSSVYGVHPSTFVVTQSGLKTLSSDVDPFAGKSGIIMRARIDKQRRDMQGVHNRRQ